MTHGSLFAGIGGFDLGFDHAGIETLWQVEIDKNCNKVLEQHYPDVKRFKDIHDCGKHNLEPVDIITGGFPCQDVSIAGKRKGLKGDRSSLWFEFYRIISEMKPKGVVVENVPGLLSSNDGKDIKLILDSLEGLGYIIDVDILDAQFFGLAQRRRRVFIVCQHVSHILREKSPLSEQTLLQCLVEMSGSILVEAREELRLSRGGLGSNAIYSKDGIQKRIDLFSIAREEALSRFLNILEDVHPKSVKGRNISELKIGEGGEGEEFIETNMEESYCGLKENLVQGAENPYMNTVKSWKNILEEFFPVVRLFTTSTVTKQITELQIYTCSKVVLSTGIAIALSKKYSPAYWSLGSSFLIVLKEYINYARQTINSLFTEMEWVYKWKDFIEQAEAIYEFVIHFGGNSSASQILFESEGMSGNTPKSGKAGEDVANSLTQRTDRCGCHTQENYLIDSMVCEGDSHSGDKGDGGVNTTLISTSHTKANQDLIKQTKVSETLEAVGTPGFAIVFQPKASVQQSMNPDKICPTLGTTKEPAILEMTHADEVIRAKREGGQGVSGIRRLTPL